MLESVDLFSMTAAASYGSRRNRLSPQRNMAVETYENRLEADRCISSGDLKEHKKLNAAA
ncbi:hypothetical protein [Neoaquamicrobium sediminum]|jgi:hypothetical protein|uniref:Uncharacterized protein n=1 Tax=Neoaquamicrobium sediminum TaxID=1849104 RepID=A0ABV3X0H9_9HYPH|nr:hypothetical protein [Mesorhizobium sediminum]MCV0398250.1 hypothetical protein [Rhizobiaceae bacterium]MCV0406746.1 hypothetical protein [Rhizobiaceae bacterium]NRC57072.1 hypothetical protein [Mesorhizobium sediminum]